MEPAAEAGMARLEAVLCEEDSAYDSRDKRERLVSAYAGWLEAETRYVSYLLAELLSQMAPEQQEQAAQWGHSTFGQSAALAAKAGVKRLWLVHYSPMITDPEEHLAQAQSIFPAAECGFDGKRITLHYEENEE